MVIENLNFKKMNRLIFILLFVVTALGLTSCYDDKGNYDYIELNEVGIAGIEDEYTVEQFEKIVIRPELHQKLNDDESKLDYLWFLYDKDNGKLADTLAFEKDLDVAVSLAPGKYEAVFSVTDSETGVFYKHKFKVSIINSFSNGVVILSELNNKANIAFLNSADKLYQDVYYSVNGEYAGENPVALGYIDNRYSQGVLIMFADGTGGVITDPTAFMKYGTYNEMFWIPSDNPEPTAFFRPSASEDLVIENGNLYSRNYMMPPPTKFDAPQTDDCDIFPAIFRVNSFSNAFYDNKGEKFKIKGSWSTADVVNMPDSIYNPADLKMEMLCGGTGFKGNGCGLFYDDDADEYYSLSFAFGFNSVIPMKKVLVTSATDIDKAKTYAVSTLSPQIFYAVDNKIYCFDVLSDVTNLVYTFESGVSVDCIELEKKDMDKVMYVGTSKSGTGKIGSFHIMDVSSNGSMSLRVSYADIAGKIVDFQYKEVN